MTTTPPRSAAPDASANPAESASGQDARVQVFFGQATQTGCRIYAQCEQAGDAVATLSGLVRGPFCAYAHTLPTNSSFRRGAGQAAGTVEAWVPDPCFWTPAMPYVYEYTLECELAGRRETISGSIGVRRLGCEQSNLRFDGKRWVLRAARAGKLESTDLAAWHDASLAAVVHWPGSIALQAATRTGVLLAVELGTHIDVKEQREQELVEQLRQLRMEAAVGIVVLDRHEAPLDLRRFARNLLFAQRFSPGEPIRPDDWADLALCELEPGRPWTLAASGRQVPLLALRPAGEGLSPQSGRAQCDLLQRDLAGDATNWAGYIV